MSLNCAEIDAVLEEACLEGGFVQGVRQPSFDSLVIEVYQKGRAISLFVCLTPQACRLHLSQKAFPKSEKPLRFVECLRSRILGSRIVQASQLGTERLITLILESSQARSTLYIRLWSNAANIILCDGDHRIVDAMYRRPKRNEVSGSPFILPEPRGTSGVSYELRQFPGTGSLSERIESFYSQTQDSPAADQSLRRLMSIKEQRLSNLEHALDRMREKAKEYSEHEGLRRVGDALLSYPKLQNEDPSTWLDVDDPYTPHGRMRVQVNPNLSIPENAQWYYEKAKKAKAGLADVEREIGRLSQELNLQKNFFEGIIERANPIEIARYLDQRKQEKASQAKSMEQPGLYLEYLGYTFIVGRSGKENDQLLRRSVKGNDTWFHVRDFPGAYVFVKAKRDKSLPLEILLAAGQLALYHSKARKNGKADVIYTQVKNLKRVKNAPVGLVLAIHEKNLRINLDQERIRSIKSEGSRLEAP